MPFAFLALVSSLVLCGVLGHLEINENNANFPDWTSSRVLQNVNSAANPIMSFEVLQYNVFNRPTEIFNEGQKERLHRVPESLLQISKNIDVVTFAEAFIDTYRNDMLLQFRKLGFSYSTTIMNDPNPFTSIVNGGVIIVSKWPIIREAQHVYRNACHDADCLAAKGVKYARLLKTVNGQSKIFNVFATHMQAGPSPEAQADRIKQAKQVHEFIANFTISEHEPVIIAGDLNVDKINSKGETTNLMEVLQALQPVQIGSQVATSDPRTNVLVGKSGSASRGKCNEQYVKNWGPTEGNVYHPSELTRTSCNRPLDGMCYCPCCSLELLDYVLYGKDYQQPSTEPTLEAHANQVSPFTAAWEGPKGMKMTMIDLSDHYPVLGRFNFAVTAHDRNPLTYHLDGCSTDSDCKFRISHCYCNGPNCYFNGNYTNGWKLDPEHPVNHNCVFSASLQCVCGPK